MPTADIQRAPVEDAPQEDAPLSRPVIGIIYPPPEVRRFDLPVGNILHDIESRHYIVDKTASFVARNGPEFENRIRQNEVNNPKFNFLTPTDAYHAYYQHKVKEFKEGKGQEPIAPKQMFQMANFAKPQLEQVKIVETFVPKEPPPEFEFIADPPSISAYDLDVVKLTAQFVARNGRQFLTTVMQREQRNYVFDFLRPQHSLFNYFTKLVEQYTKILIPPKNLLDKLKKESATNKEVLDQVKYRVEWAKYQERERKKEEDLLEKERIAYAQVDWHDFVVVETVDFQPNEQGNLPPPTTPEEVGARMLAQERYEKGEMDDAVEMEVESDDEEDMPLPSQPAPPKLPPPPAPDNNQVQDMDESDEEEDDEKPPEPKAPPKIAAPPPPPPPPPTTAPPLPPTPDQVIIRKDYNPKARHSTAEPGADQYLVSPLTGEKIPAHKVQEHMRIGLLDPSWMEKRQRAIDEKREQEEVYAPGSAIDTNLKQMAERRTDIFGIGTEETQIGKKIGEEEKRDRKVVWDGHSASMEKVSQRAREHISIEEQIATIHKVKGLVPDEEKEKIGPTMPKPGGPPMPQKIPQVPLPPVPLRPPNMIPGPPASLAPPPPPQQPPQPPPRPPMPVPPRQGLMVLPPRPPAPMRLPMGGMNQPMPPMSFEAPQPPQPPPPPKPMMMDDEPPSKRQKTEDNLIPENIFLQRHKGPVMLKVMIPNVPDKPEWKLSGQTLDFTLPLTDSVSVLKAKLNEVLGMPAGKQKLQYEGIFIKDSHTLAFYNFMNGATVSLALKERGGRKK